MTKTTFSPQEGGCTCGDVRYKLLMHPMFVHCCHCSWCQRETGSAFALNALIEADQVALLKGETETINTPSNSGMGQNIVRCRICKIAIWSNYSAAEDLVHFVRVGTLDKPDLFAPDIHIFTASKQDWAQLPEGVPSVEAYYRRSKYWHSESVERYKKAVGGS